MPSLRLFDAILIRLNRGYAGHEVNKSFITCMSRALVVSSAVEKIGCPHCKNFIDRFKMVMDTS